jgi:WD40 repeat protein
MMPNTPVATSNPIPDSARAPRGRDAGEVTPNDSPQFDDSVKRFRDAWQRGEQPKLDDYLPADPAMRPRALAALAAADIELQIAAGNIVGVDAYLYRYPELNEPGIATGLFLLGLDLKRRHNRAPAAAFPESLAGPPSEPKPSSTGDWQINISGTFLHAAGERFSEQPTLSPSPEASPSGTSPKPTVPGYVILDQLGAGGMGIVYWARHQALQRTVALKMILAGAHSRPEQRRRFLAEARAVAALTHPNIVQIYEVGEHEGVPYCALEYLAGGSLFRRLRDRPMTPREAAELMATLARAVHAAHQAGIVHRDLKPENVLLAGDGTPKVGDFGLAKRLDITDGATPTGDVLGTPSYMAPEQAEGHSNAVGPAADVYGLGAILYECLTGRAPFSGLTPMDTLVQVLTVEPVPPSKLRGGLARDMEIITLKCLEKDPARRYPTAEALAEDLLRFLNAEPIRARRAGPLERARKWARRRPAVAGLLALVALVTMLGFVGITWQWREAVEARDQETEQRQLAVGAKQQAEAAREQEAEQRRRADVARDEEAKQRDVAEDALYASTIARARLEWQANKCDDVERLLFSKHCPEARRNWEWSFLHRLNHPDLFSLRDQPSWVWGVAASPDGRLLATCGGGNPFWRSQKKILPGEAALWDLTTGTQLRTLRDRDGVTHRNIVTRIAFSPDGQLIATGSADGTAKLWEVATGTCRHTLVGHGEEVLGVAFSPDGKQVATIGSDHNVKLWSVATGQLQHTCTGHTGVAGGLAFVAGSGQLVSVSENEIKIWNASIGTELATLESNQGPYHSVAMSPDGRLVAVAAGSLVKLWDRESRQLMRLLTGATNTIEHVTFSPDGQYVAGGSKDTTIRLWRVKNGEEVATLRGHYLGVLGLAFSPDGQRLFTGGQDEQIKAWDLTVSPATSPLRTAPEIDLARPEALAFSADSQKLMTAHNRGDVYVFQTATGEALDEKSVAVFRDFLVPCETLCLDPTGRWLAGPSSDDNRVVKVWETATCVERSKLTGLTAQVLFVSVCQTGRVAACSRTGEIRVWDGTTGQRLPATFPLTGVRRLALSRLGDRLAVAASDTIRVYSLPTGQVEQMFRDPAEDYFGVAFDDKGERLAAAGLQGRVRIWELSTGRATVTMNEGPRLTMDLAFNPRGDRLAVAGNRLIKLLDANTGNELLVLRGTAQQKVSANGFNARIRFSPDGNRLAAVCHDFDEPISIWSIGDISVPRQLEIAERRVFLAHLREANECSIQGEVAAAAFHLDWLTKAPMRNPRDYLSRGNQYGRAGQIPLAAADYARAFAPGESYESEFSRQHAILRLAIGDVDGYRQICGKMRERWKEAPNRDTLLAIGLAPQAVGEPQVTVQLAQQLMMKNSTEPWNLLALAFAHLRAHEPAKAREQFEAALKLDPQWQYKPLNWLGLALAHHSLGNDVEGRQWLAKAEAWYATQDPGRPQRNRDFWIRNWWEGLAFQILRNEATAAITGKAAEEKK